jgi:iron(III) transport system ATP-binding protein
MRNKTRQGEEMSVNITIKHAKKTYEDTVVIPDLTLTIKEGEFFTLLGPSGCGKTTLLRMIAGFNTIEGGDFYFNEKRINDIDPAKRNIGMVFQNYAIFPHYTVRKNVEFGLQNKKIPRDKISPQADKFLKLMQIDQFAARMPEKLSGGQQQRVALARALCIEPDVLLMDEPLSNLDAKLRVEMRSVIKHIQRDIGITTVYVTHDQEEAMAVSDRIAVMNNGVIQHIGTPKNIYQRPANRFVSTFIGRSNIIAGNLFMKEKRILVKIKNYEFPFTNIREEFKTDQEILVSIRPEELLIQDKNSPGIRAVIEDCVFLGLNTHYFMCLEDGTKTISIRESLIDNAFEPGDEVSLAINTEKINIFTANGKTNMLNGVFNGLESL